MYPLLQLEAARVFCYATQVSLYVKYAYPVVQRDSDSESVTRAFTAAHLPILAASQVLVSLRVTC